MSCTCLQSAYSTIEPRVRAGLLTLCTPVVLGAKAITNIFEAVIKMVTFFHLWRNSNCSLGDRIVQTVAEILNIIFSPILLIAAEIIAFLGVFIGDAIISKGKTIGNWYVKVEKTLAIKPSTLINVLTRKNKKVVVSDHASFFLGPMFFNVPFKREFGISS